MKLKVPTHPAARYSVLFVVGLLVLIRLMTGTLIGVLICAIAIYFAWPHFTLTQPMPIIDAIAFSASHDLQSSLTVLGLIVAYMLSIAAWKRQKAMEVRLDSASEILLFFEGANREVLALELFARELNAIQSKMMLEPPVDLTFEANYAASRLPAIDATRQAVSQRGIEVHALRTRHELVVSGSLATLIAFDKAGAALAAVLEDLWFPLPLGAQNAEHFLDIIRRSDARKWARFERVGAESRGIMSAASAGIKGFTQGPFFRPGVASFVRLWTTSKAFHTKDPDT